MKYNLKLEKHEKTFAVKHITDFYRYGAKCKYFNLIYSILKNFEENITDYNQLKTDDDCENIIIKKLISVFNDKLGEEKENNPTGLFGVKRAFFTDGTNLFYKDLIKDEFVKSYPIYASKLKVLKTKVKSEKGVWLIFDDKKYGKLSASLFRSTTKTTRKRSKGYSGSKKLGGFPRPIYHSSLTSEIHNSYGRQ